MDHNWSLGVTGSHLTVLHGLAGQNSHITYYLAVLENYASSRSTWGRFS